MTTHCISVAGIATLLLATGSQSVAAAPKNVILFIGDGMSSEHVKAAGYSFNGTAGQFSFEQLDHFAWMEHNNSAGNVTDSAASATALATGLKVNNDVVSVAVASGPDPRSAAPSDGRDLTTVLETLKAQGKSTGLVTNSFFSDATPAAFGAHVADRAATGVITNDYLNQTVPNVVFGGGQSSTDVSAFSARGYTVATDRASMQAIDPAAVTHAAGFFGVGEFAFAYDQSVGSTSFYNSNPYLHEMTTSALNLLSHDPDGLFLMVECDRIDGAGHLPVAGANKIERGIFEIRELSRAVQSALDFAAVNPDTLIVVTADHETGGLTAGLNNGAGTYPSAQSGSTLHNATWVPVYAGGSGAHQFRGLIDNTDVPALMLNAPAEPLAALQTISFRNGVNGYAAAVDTQVRADQPDSTHGASTTLLVDADDDPAQSVATAAPVQTVLRFDDIFAAGAIPPGATITLAKLSIFTGNGGSDGTQGKLSVHRLLTEFDENTSWNNAGRLAGNGFSLNANGADDDDYLAAAEYVFPAPSNNAIATFDVTQSVIAWLALGGEGNFGWIVLIDSNNGWRLHSSNAESELVRPLLEVTYSIPEPCNAVLIAFVGTGVLSRRRIRRA